MVTVLFSISPKSGRLMGVAGKRPFVGPHGAGTAGHGSHHRADPDCQRPFDEGCRATAVSGPRGVQALLGMVPTGNGS